MTFPKPSLTEGWSPTRGCKWHYFTTDGRSLCLRWGFNTAPRDQGNDDSPSNCAECRRRLAKRLPLSQGGNP